MDQKIASSLRISAARLRGLADSFADLGTREILRAVAAEYDAKARFQESKLATSALGPDRSFA